MAETAVKMIDVVQKFHKLGFIHRDIKPSNFRVKDEQVYLIDFGTVHAYKDKNNVHI